MPRKLPQITSDSSAFWQGGESGRLMIHRCSTCRRFFHPPAPICPFCGSLDVAPQATSGRGRIATYTINHQAWKPELATPYVVAIVELVLCIIGLIAMFVNGSFSTEGASTIVSLIFAGFTMWIANNIKVQAGK